MKICALKKLSILAIFIWVDCAPNYDGLDYGNEQAEPGENRPPPHLPAPNISEIQPEVGSRDEEITLHIRGTHFLPGAIVTLGGMPAVSVTVGSSEELQAVIPAQHAVKLAKAVIRVENPDRQYTERDDLFRFVRRFPVLWGQPGPGGALGVVRVGDFDQDGILDAITAEFEDPAWITSFLMPKVTDGNFPNEIKDLSVTNMSSSGPAPQLHPTFQDLIPGDFDRDGKLDIVVSLPHLGEIWILQNDGMGRFYTALQRLSVGIQPYALAVFDLNRDTLLDILVTDMSTNQLYTFLGDSSGHFSAGKTYPAGKSPNAMQLWDINNDGFIDVVIANRDSSSVTILKGDRNGDFTLATQFDACFEPTAIVIGDLDKDLHPDVVISCPRGDGARSTSGGIQIAFEVDRVKPTRTEFISIPELPWGVLIEDFDGDGHQDVVVGNLEGELVYFVRNRWREPGTFAPPLQVIEGFEHYKTAPISLQSGDFNGDGFPDLITADSAFGSISLLLSNPLDR